MVAANGYPNDYQKGEKVEIDQSIFEDENSN